MTLIRPAVTTLVVLMCCASAQAQGKLSPEPRPDVEKLLEVTGASSMAGRLATIASEQLIDTMRRQQPQIPERVVAIVKEVLSAEFARAFDGPQGIHGEIVRIYASHFTRDEVQALLAFYSTEIGKKTITVMPQLAEEGAAAGQQWALTNMPRIMDVLQQRLQAEGLLK